MIKLTQLLKEIRINQPGSILDNDFIKSAYNFFKNDQDVFKNSGIANMIMINQNKILDAVWDYYSSFLQGHDIEDLDQNSIPSNKEEILDPNKQTINVNDSWYIIVHKFLLPYIVNHLKKTGWEYTGEYYPEVKKDNKIVDIFNYMKDITNYDTDPRETLYEEFAAYFDENF
jgi:hypothetical protein